jgi:hypothetical protein
MENKKQTPVDWLVENAEDFLSGLIAPSIIEKAKEMEKQMLCDLVEQLKDYTNQSKSILGHDEREPIEFVEIFLEEKK